MSEVSAHRYHDICAGHRVVGHESKCRHLHGHNYRVHFYCRAHEASSKLDNLGRVIDFSVIKEKLCEWLEENWDHKFLYWSKDMLIQALSVDLDSDSSGFESVHHYGHEHSNFVNSFVELPFNPTAENLALHLLHIVGPVQLSLTGVELYKVVIEETAKCAVTVEL